MPKQLRYLDGGERVAADEPFKPSELEPDTLGKELGAMIAWLLQRAPEGFWLEGIVARRKRRRGWPAGKTLWVRVTWCRDPDKAKENRDRAHPRNREGGQP